VTTSRILGAGESSAHTILTVLSVYLSCKYNEESDFEYPITWRRTSKAVHLYFEEGIHFSIQYSERKALIHDE